MYFDDFGNEKCVAQIFLYGLSFIRMRGRKIFLNMVDSEITTDAEIYTPDGVA